MKATLTFAQFLCAPQRDTPLTFLKKDARLEGGETGINPGRCLSSFLLTFYCPLTNL